jgi:hypothetical protein
VRVGGVRGQAAANWVLHAAEGCDHLTCRRSRRPAQSPGTALLRTFKEILMTTKTLPTELTTVT